MTRKKNNSKKSKNLMAVIRELVASALAIYITWVGIGMLRDTNPNNDAIGFMLTVGGTAYFGIQLNSNSVNNQ